MTLQKWKIEFPEMETLGIDIPDGFIDESWRNDIMPSFYDKDNNLAILVDMEKSEDREFPESLRYHLVTTDSQGHTQDVIIATDDGEKLLSKVNEMRQPISFKM